MTNYPLLLTGFFLFFFFGCALQSSLVDLEQELKQTQKIQQEVHLLREQLEKTEEALTEKAQDRSKGIVELLGEIHQLQEALRYLEGRLEEEGHKVSESMQKMDDQAYQLGALSDRIAAIEKRLPTQENQDKGNTESGKTGEAGQKEVSLSPVEAYNLAYNDYLRGNYDLAIISFQNYINQYPDSTFLPQAIYWIGQSYYNKGSYQEAVNHFKQIENRFPTHDKAPNALLKTALSFLELSKPDRARELLLKVVEQFPQSIESYLAKDKLESLNKNP